MGVKITPGSPKRWYQITKSTWTLWYNWRQSTYWCCLGCIFPSHQHVWVLMSFWAHCAMFCFVKVWWSSLLMIALLFQCKQEVVVWCLLVWLMMTEKHLGTQRFNHVQNIKIYLKSLSATIYNERGLIDCEGHTQDSVNWRKNLCQVVAELLEVEVLAGQGGSHALSRQFMTDWYFSLGSTILVRF